MADTWRAAALPLVERREPYVTGRPKILPLHVIEAALLRRPFAAELDEPVVARLPLLLLVEVGVEVDRRRLDADVLDQIGPDGLEAQALDAAPGPGP